jgi:Arc/MetJ family transcription regulator
MIMYMRTNLVLNDDLVREAMRLSAGRSKRAVVEEALRTYVAVKSGERAREAYRDRLRRIAGRLRDLKLREKPSDVLRADRDRR